MLLNLLPIEKSNGLFRFRTSRRDCECPLFDQMLSLKTLLTSDLPEIIFDASYVLENGKQIHRIYIPFDKKFSIYNKNTWRDCYEFFVDQMDKLELFFNEYEAFIKQAI